MMGALRNCLHFQGLGDGGSLAGPRSKDVGQYRCLRDFGSEGCRWRWDHASGETVTPEAAAALWVGRQAEWEWATRRNPSGDPGFRLGDTVGELLT